jgi:hypothetical protein
VRWVTGTWTVPSIAVPAVTYGHSVYGADSWIGIDGFSGAGSSVLLQAGVWQEIDGYTHGTEIFPWWQWLPDHTQRLENFAVHPGDTVSVLIVRLTTGTGTDPAMQSLWVQAVVDFANDMGWSALKNEVLEYGSVSVPLEAAFVYFGNATQDTYTEFVTATASPDHFLAGTTAEWIVETACVQPPDQFSGELLELSRFDEVLFANAACGTHGTVGLLPEAPAFVSIASTEHAGLVVLDGNTQPATINNIVSGRLEATGQLMFPGLRGPNLIKVFNVWSGWHS